MMHDSQPSIFGGWYFFARKEVNLIDCYESCEKENETALRLKREIFRPDRKKKHMRMGCGMAIARET
jgi:hypothetical protein